MKIRGARLFFNARCTLAVALFAIRVYALRLYRSFFPEKRSRVIQFRDTFDRSTAFNPFLGSPDRSTANQHDFPQYFSYDRLVFFFFNKNVSFGRG